MTDELTPEEKEALRKLPRERMPSAGLEERVVGALRERGVLSKRRRRTIAITNSRVVAFLAACVALVIGAYSIGLQRGVGDQAIPEPANIEQAGRIRGYGTPPSQTPEAPEEKRAEAERGGKTLADEVVTHGASMANDADRRKTLAQNRLRDDKPAVSGEVEKANEGAFKKEDSAEAPPEPTAQPEEAPASKLSRRLEAYGEQPVVGKKELTEEKDKAEVPATPAERAAPKAQSEPRKETRAPGVMMESVRPAQPKGSTGAVRPLSTQASPPVTLRTLSFLLNGTTPVVVIYTSDGPIRIRLADED
jgi:hypothetical protein